MKAIISKSSPIYPNQAQQVLEEQGYIVCVFPRFPESLGHVISEIPANDKYGYPAIPGPLKVAGSATAQEYESQRARYFARVPIQVHSGYYVFRKVVAE